MRSRRPFVAILALLAACSGSSFPRDGASDHAESAAPPAAAPGAPELAVGAAAGSRATQLPGAGATDSAAPRMLIRTGDASLEVEALEPAVEQVRALAARLGGFVANTSYQGGRDRVREASLELRIPADRFEAAASGLDSVGEIEWLNVAVQDVGEEYVDLSARTANAKRLETRLVELLATRTGKLEDVLAVERELARVREEIERFEGRLRFLRTRVATSTLVVRLHEPAPVIGGTGGTGVIGEAFRQAWRNFIAAVAALIASSGVLVPLAAVGVAGWLLFRRLRKRAAPISNREETVER